MTKSKFSLHLICQSTQIDKDWVNEICRKCTGFRPTTFSTKKKNPSKEDFNGNSRIVLQVIHELAWAVSYCAPVVGFGEHHCESEKFLDPLNICVMIHWENICLITRKFSVFQGTLYTYRSRLSRSKSLTAHFIHYHLHRTSIGLSN